MKIGVVTVYNSYNCGSFLQAYALEQTLKRNGHDVFFIKRKQNIKDRLLYILPYMAYKFIFQRDLEIGKRVLDKYIIYKKAVKRLKVIPNISNMDAIVYGSDTIWNLDDPCFGDEWQRYFGYGVKQKKVAYSASVASTPEETFLKRQELADCLMKFHRIAVRDERTYDIVKKMLPGETAIAKTVDPTMLLLPEDYAVLEESCYEENFILVYAFCVMKQDAVQEIRDFAKKTGKKIIAFGNEFPADVNIPFAPSKMMGYYKKADYIVTNTFHGNVFSILFNKQFVSYGKNKKKVKHLLEEFGLSCRLIDETDSVSAVFDTTIDYTQINQTLEEKRKASLQYLKEALS